jgi:hypothetical protein
MYFCFEAADIVEALVAGRCAEKGAAGVVAMTLKHQAGLRTYAS